MKPLFLPNHPDKEIQVRKSARARRLTLRISRLDQKITLSAPNHSSAQDLIDFIAEHENWVLRHLAKMPAKTQLALGKSLPILGQDFIITQGQDRRIHVTDGHIYLPQNASDPSKTIKAFLRLKAREELAQASDFYSKRLGKPYQKLTFGIRGLVGVRAAAKGI